VAGQGQLADQRRPAAEGHLAAHAVALRRDHAVAHPVRADYGRIQWPLSRVASDAWNLEYRFQPAGSRWLDLYANLWRTETDSDTYTAGGFPNFAQAIRRGTRTSPILRNTALANARNDRTGLTLSNRFALHSTLDLTVGGNWRTRSWVLVARTSVPPMAGACTRVLAAARRARAISTWNGVRSIS
jgi:hypothetical protein